MLKMISNVINLHISYSIYDIWSNFIKTKKCNINTLMVHLQLVFDKIHYKNVT